MRANENSKLVIYPPFPERIRRDYTYSVSVTQGDRTEKLPVYDHVEVSPVSRNPYDGTDEHRRFSTFAFCGESVRVDIRVNRDFKEYTVIPSAFNFKSSFKDGVISVLLDKPEYFMIRLDNADTSILTVFADYPEEVPELDADDPNTLIVDGWYESDNEKGTIDVTEPNTTIYIKAGSVLHSRIHITADNCRIFGRGALVDPFEDIYNYDISKTRTQVIEVKDADYTKIDGIHMLNAHNYNIYCSGDWAKSNAVGTLVTNVKILSTQMSSDGIAFGYYTKDSLADHCYVYCGDNCMVFEEDSTYRNMILGTTCAAAFPQTDVRNILLEDIHVFRSDDGAINHFYGGSMTVAVDNFVINNFDVCDCTRIFRYFFTNSMGVANKNATVKNTSLGDLSEQEMIQISNLWSGKDMPTRNFDLKYINIAADGRIFDSIEQFIDKTVDNCDDGSNHVTYETEEGFIPVVRRDHTVNYKNHLNVWVGKYQLFFAHPAFTEGQRIYLSYDEIRKELRTVKEAPTVTVNGVCYVASDLLVEAGMAKSVKLLDNDLVITPVYNGEELYLADEGLISRYTEYICYNIHLETSLENDETVYTVLNHNKSTGGGIHRQINEEVKKYGAGSYRLTLDLKGGENGKLKTFLKLRSTPERDPAVYDVTTEWQSFEYNFDISKTDVDEKIIALIITGDTKFLPTYHAKNMKLKKVK